MLSIVTWLWSQPGYPTRYGAREVNALARMVRQHYRRDHRFICVTNDAAGIEPSIEIIADDEDFADMKSPHGARYPCCYRRLRLFKDDAAETFGERIVSLDLDTVITRDMSPIWDRDDDFIGWRDPNRPDQLCGAMFMLRTGSRAHVWDEFDPKTSPQLAAEAGWRGSDQAWMTYAAGDDCARWDQADGVYSFKRHLKGRALPADARIVMFHGNPKPTDPSVMQLDWMQKCIA